MFRHAIARARGVAMATGNLLSADGAKSTQVKPRPLCSELLCGMQLLYGDTPVFDRKRVVKKKSLINGCCGKKTQTQAHAQTRTASASFGSESRFILTQLTTFRYREDLMADCLS